MPANAESSRTGVSVHYHGTTKCSSKTVWHGRPARVRTGETPVPHRALFESVRSHGLQPLTNDEGVAFQSSEAASFVKDRPAGLDR